MKTSRFLGAGQKHRPRNGSDLDFVFPTDYGLRTQPFDLALMDVQMPQKDRFETTAVIRDIEKTRGGH